MNVALVRVLYAHALVGAPRLALGRFAPLGRAARRPPARDGRRVPLTPPRAAKPLSARARRGALHRRRAAARPDARLRGDRAAAAAPVRVVRRGARRTTPAGAGSRRQPDLRLALRAATRVAHSEHATRGPGARTRHPREDAPRRARPGSRPRSRRPRSGCAPRARPSPRAPRPSPPRCPSSRRRSRRRGPSSCRAAP